MIICATSVLYSITNEEDSTVISHVTADHPVHAPDKQPMPKLGDVFEIIYDFGQNPELEKMPNRFGYKNEWLYDGIPSVGRQTRRFKWVKVGKQKNLNAVIAELIVRHGNIPSGQWIEAIIKLFEHDGIWRGIPDQSWTDKEDDSRCFPYLHPVGKPYLLWVGCDQDEEQYWLVEVQ